MIQGFRHGGAYGPGAGMGRLRQQFQQQALQQQQPQQMQRLQQMQQMQQQPQQLQQMVGVSKPLGQQAMAMSEPILSPQRLQMLRQQAEAIRPSEPGDLASGPMSPDPALVGLSAPSQISGFQPPRQDGARPGFAKPLSLEVAVEVRAVRLQQVGR